MVRKVVVTDVFDDGNTFHVETDEALCFGLQKRFLNGVVPKIGDKINLICRCHSQIVGVDINGKKIYRLSEQQQKELLKEQETETKERLKKEFKENEGLLDEMFNHLPQLLQRRIELFREFVPNFRVEEEFYELSSVYLSYEIYANCKCGNIESFSRNVDRFNVVNYIKSHKILKKLGISTHQLMFAQALATSIFRDEMEEGIDMMSPTKEQLLRSLVMNLPNAISVLSDPFCWPRRTYIERYFSNLE